MPSIFRRRKVSCFYCGQHSVPGDAAKYHPNGRVSMFTCLQCNADNHLDKNGEIADYVPEAPPSAVNFGHRRTSSRVASGTSSAPASPTFCTQCEHNQLILQNARLQYESEMPQEDHPDYHYYVNTAYPKYIKDMEAKFPPMCAECIPRVKQRLKQVNYDAKVASLGHMLARSERPSTPVELGPMQLLKWAFWGLRGVVWWWGNVLFLVWHVSSLFHPAAAVVENTVNAGWIRCLLSSFSKSEFDIACHDVSYYQASQYFPWTLLGFWWLYRQLGVEMHPEKKLVGGREYLHIEIAVVVIRTAAWLLLRQGGLMRGFDEEARLNAHALFFFIGLMCFMFSITCLKLEDPPSFSLRETGPPSPQKTRPPSPNSYTAKGSPKKQTPRPQQQRPQRQQPQQQQRQTPQLSLTRTPPLRPIYINQTIPPITPSYRNSNAEIVPSPSPTPKRYLDDDAMDWDPITPMPPTRGNSPWAIRQPSESPTRNPGLSSRTPAGRLSLNPTEIRFGQPQTPVSLFNRPTMTTEPDPIKTNPTPVMAEARFRRIAPPTMDDTGLEGIFDGGLKLSDEPEDIAQGGLAQERELLTEVLGRLGLLLIAASTAALAPTASKSIALPIVVTAALWRMARNDTTTRIFSGMEVLAALATGTMIALNAARERTLANTGMLLVAIATVMEVWRLLLRMQRQRKRAFWREERAHMRRRQTLDANSGATTAAAYDSFGFRRAPTPTEQRGRGRSRPAMGAGGGGLFDSFSSSQ